MIDHAPPVASDFPPGPPTRIASKAMPNLGRLLNFMRDVVAQHGGAAHWTIGKKHFFLLDDPALIEDFLVHKERDFRRGRGVQRLKRFLGNGLLTAEEPAHLRQRRLMQPAFHRDRIAGYGRQMVAATQRHIDTWKDGSVIELRAEMTDLTLAIAAQTLFSSEVGDTDVRDALGALMQSFPASISRFSELFDMLPMLPITRRIRSARKHLDELVYGLIAKRRRDPAAHDDLLDMLLAAADDGAAMDELQVRDEIVTLFLAGHETTANALTWAWYLLARNPAAAQQMRAEIDAVVGDRPPDSDDVPRLTFTHDVFAEAMRLYPPAWMLIRGALRDTTIGPYAVPKGSIVLVSQYATHRNARYWTDPETFAPDRWRTDKPSRFAYFPFGGGARRCIGESFAWMEGVLLLATIAQRVDLQAVDSKPVGLEPLLTLRPKKPLRMRVTT